MRYLSLAEALLIAEAVTGLETSTLVRVCQLDLLDSALHAPQAGVGDEDFYPGFVEKAAVLVVRIARNHPLPDGNKRLAWQALTMFYALNDHELHVDTRGPRSCRRVARRFLSTVRVTTNRHVTRGAER